jgi:hypothetical protein
MEEFDIFLSHHSSDKPWVIALKAALTARGVKVWLDQDEIRPGDLYIDALERGVELSRCVAVVISPRSLKSRWVKEEYSRALQLFNSRERDVRIIPCLIQDAALPGFLSTRHYVDFRDASRFEDGVDRLHRAILPDDAPEPGQPATQAAPAILTSAEVSPLELKYLDRWIAAVRKERSTLLIVRTCAPVLGLLAAWLTGGTDFPLWGFGGAASVTGLLGVAATARPWSTRSLELQQLATQRDALELCSQEFRPVCPDVVKAFNRLLKRRIGIEPDAREVSV